MKHALVLTLGAWVLAGCAGSQVTPKPELLTGVRTLTVVPVEAMPFKIVPNDRAEADALAAFLRTASPLRPAPLQPGASDQAALVPLASGAVPLSAAPSLAVRTVASGIGLVVAVAVIAQLVEAGQEVPGAVPNLEARPAGPLWMPSVDFAQHAVARLQGQGARPVHLLDAYYRLPVTDRGETWHMENWLAPIRRWHRADTSPLDYRSQGLPSGTAILEVGMGNYEYTQGKLFVSVLLKLVDPTTNQVVGRTGHLKALWSPPALASLLENEGRGMRDLIETTGQQLIDQCLVDLGLLVK